VLDEAQGVEVESVELLGGLDVVKDDAGGDGRGGMAGEAEVFEGMDAELALDERDGVVAGPDPVVDGGSCNDAVACTVQICSQVGIG